MTTIETLKQGISSIISANGCSAEFFFLFDNKNGMRIKSVDINELDHDELEKIFIKSITDTLLLNDAPGVRIVVA